MSNKKRQSSVEWLIERVQLSGGNLLVCDAQKAKEMHRQEIEDACEDGILKGESPMRKTGNEYYNETYTYD